MRIEKVWDIYKKEYVNSGKALCDEIYKKAINYISIDKHCDFQKFIHLAVKKNVPKAKLEKIVYALKMLSRGTPYTELKKEFKDELELLNIAKGYVKKEK